MTDPARVRRFILDFPNDGYPPELDDQDLEEADPTAFPMAPYHRVICHLMNVLRRYYRSYWVRMAKAITEGQSFHQVTTTLLYKRVCEKVKINKCLNELTFDSPACHEYPWCPTLAALLKETGSDPDTDDVFFTPTRVIRHDRALVPDDSPNASAGVLLALPNMLAASSEIYMMLDEPLMTRQEYGYQEPVVQKAAEVFTEMEQQYPCLELERLELVAGGRNVAADGAYSLYVTENRRLTLCQIDEQAMNDYVPYYD